MPLYYVLYFHFAGNYAPRRLIRRWSLDGRASMYCVIVFLCGILTVMWLSGQHVSASIGRTKWWRHSEMCRLSMSLMEERVWCARVPMSWPCWLSLPHTAVWWGVGINAFRPDLSLTCTSIGVFCGWWWISVVVSSGGTWIVVMSSGESGVLFCSSECANVFAPGRGRGGDSFVKLSSGSKLSLRNISIFGIPFTRRYLIRLPVHILGSSMIIKRTEIMVYRPKTCFKFNNNRLICTQI